MYPLRKDREKQLAHHCLTGSVYLTHYINLTLHQLIITFFQSIIDGIYFDEEKNEEFLKSFYYTKPAVP